MHLYFMVKKAPDNLAKENESIKIFKEYQEASSPETWLVNEVCRYLFPDLEDSEELEERLNAFDEVLSKERVRVYGGIPDPDEVVLFVISVQKAEQPLDPLSDSFISTTQSPSAALLLETCSNVAEAGEQIVIEIIYGDGTKSTEKEMWPFSMKRALELTAPAYEKLDPELEVLDPELEVQHLDYKFHESAGSNQIKEYSYEGRSVDSLDDAFTASQYRRVAEDSKEENKICARQYRFTGKYDVKRIKQVVGVISLVAIGGIFLGRRRLKTFSKTLIK